MSDVGSGSTMSTTQIPSFTIVPAPHVGSWFLMSDVGSGSTIISCDFITTGFSKESTNIRYSSSVMPIPS